MTLQGIRRALQRACNALAGAMTLLGVLLFTLVVAMNGWEAVARYFFSASSIYTVEVSLVIATVVYFVGYAKVIHYNEDIRMDFFVERMRPGSQLLIDVLNEVVAVIFFGVLAYGSWRYFDLSLGIPDVLLPVSQAYVVVPILLGSGACLIVSLNRLLNSTAKLLDRD